MCLFINHLLQMLVLYCCSYQEAMKSENTSNGIFSYTQYSNEESEFHKD